MVYRERRPGLAEWDIGQILTRHDQSMNSPCERVRALWQPDGPRPNDIRLAEALATPCTCGAGDDPSERTSIQEDTNAQASP